MPFGLAPKYLFPPAVQYVARLDGATQYWQLSEPVSVDVGDKLRIYYKADTVQSGSFKSMIARDANFSSIIQLSTDGTYSYQRVDLFVDGQQKLPTDMAPIDGAYHEVIVECTTAFSTSLLGAAWSNIPTSTFRHFDNALYGFEHIRGDEVILSIPLTNKAQGATQLATVGNINATMLNYTGDEWEVQP